MTRFVVLGVLIRVLFFCGVSMAATSTFVATVTPISATQFEQINQLNFGSIINQSGAHCVIDESGVLSGPCLSQNNTASVGRIQVSGLAANQGMNILIQGSSDGLLSFSPTATLQGTSNQVAPISNGQQRSFVTSAEAQNITLTVFGELALLTTLPEGESRNIEYSVTINIE